MFLIIIKGPKIGTVFPLSKEGIFVIGRGRESDFQVLDLTISRKHCQIERTRNNNFYIKDLNSTNKTFVNAKIVEDIVKLEVGDIIEIGDTVLLFTDQKEIPIKSVTEYDTLRMKQTKRKNMKINPLFIFFALIVFFSNSYILSDTLYLKNGGIVEGIIGEEGDYYVVNLGYGTASFHKSTVSEVKYSSGDQREQIKEGWVKEKPKSPPESVTTGSSATQKGKGAEEQPKHLEIGEPGQRIDITKYVVKDKITIFDFYSPYCGPCLRVAPRLERLVQTRDNIVVRKININRPSVRGIDWDSPVVNQYNIKYVPYFKIYNERGSLWLEGESASDKVYSWLE